MRLKGFDPVVVYKSDPRARYKDVYEIMQLAVDAGFRKLQLKVIKQAQERFPFETIE
jgi:biopolymer transport protein ExbD